MSRQPETPTKRAAAAQDEEYTPPRGRRPPRPPVPTLTSEQRDLVLIRLLKDAETSNLSFFHLLNIFFTSEIAFIRTKRREYYAEGLNNVSSSLGLILQHSNYGPKRRRLSRWTKQMSGELGDMLSDLVVRIIDLEIKDIRDDRDKRSHITSRNLGRRQLRRYPSKLQLGRRRRQISNLSFCRFTRSY